MINEKAARSYWPGEDPIGKRISFDAGTSEMPYVVDRHRNCEGRQGERLGRQA